MAIVYPSSPVTMIPSLSDENNNQTVPEMDEMTSTTDVLSSDAKSNNQAVKQEMEQDPARTGNLYPNRLIT